MIFPNVEVGEGTVIEDGAIVGKPKVGAEAGQFPTRIGAGGIVRSGTVIYANTFIGDGFNSGHNAVIREDNLLGDRCSVGSCAELLPGNRVGSETRIHASCFLEFVTLGSRVFLGPHVVFTSDPHPACPRYLECVLGATVDDDVSIGANSTILPGVHIHAGSLVGAGSLVTADVIAGVLVAGHPARVRRPITQVECFKGFYERAYIWREKPAGPPPADSLSTPTSSREGLDST